MAATVRLWDKDFNLISSHKADAQISYSGIFWDDPQMHVRAHWMSGGIHYTAETS